MYGICLVRDGYEICLSGEICDTMDVSLDGQPVMVPQVVSFVLVNEHLRLFRLLAETQSGHSRIIFP